jgi:hypothetical protein
MVPHKGVSMGFIYPPFASLVMLPLAMVPVAVGKSVLAVLTAALVMAALVGCIRAIDARRRRIGRRELSLFAFAAATIVGGVFRWSDSIRYWCHPDVVRASLGDSARTVSWLALAAVVLGLAV